MKKFVLIASLCIVMLCVVAIGLLLLCINNGSVINQVGDMNTNISVKGFDAELWKAQYKKFERDNPRIGMIPALEREILKKGMSQETIREILGPPEQTRGNMDFYDLGVSPFGIDYEQYVIEYDDDNKVVQFFTRRG